VGTKVLVPEGHDWACKCWSARGMSGNKSARPLKGMVYPSSAGTLAFVRSGLNAHSKHLKIPTMFTVWTLSPYKNYSSLLRCQANICVHIATKELRQ
jgi:hypothetical protein